MSYILEALNKAEAERRAGSAQAEVPQASLITQPLPATQRRVWLWFAVPAAIAAAGTAIWIARPPAKPAPQKLALKAETVPPVLPKQEEKPARKPVEKVVAKPAEKPVDKKRSSEREQKKEAKAPATEPSIGTLRDLPEQIQREIPLLAIGGYIYSANKADRSVLINNRLLRDGDEIAPGLVLEQMQPSGMILSYKGYRYRSSY